MKLSAKMIQVAVNSVIEFEKLVGNQTAIRKFS